MKTSGLLSLLLFIACITFGDSLKCYSCKSFKSWDACEKNKTSAVCPAVGNDSPNCYKYEKTTTLGALSSTTYKAGCTTASKCDISNLCAGGSSCFLNCCDTAPCFFNHGTKTQVATTLLVMTAIISFLCNI